MTNLSITGGLDVGNGYVKGALRGPAEQVVSADASDKFDLPSGVALVTQPVDLATPDNEAVSVLAGDIYNELDVSFTSPLIDSPYRHLFGRRGLHAQSSRYEEFDVATDQSKAEQSLSKVLVLGLFAAKALRDYVAEHKVLPVEQLEVTARVGLALPINEYRSYRASYAASFKEGTHLVTIRNFETPVTVKITFVDVQVIAEGASAQFAISQRGIPLVRGLLADVRSQGVPLTGLTPEDIHGAKHTVGIDIGEGTVNFPVYSDGKFNADSSRTFAQGYGTVLLNSMEPLRRKGLSFQSRKKLAAYLLATPSAMKRAEFDRVTEVVEAEAELFAEQVVEEFGKVFADVNRDTEVAYIYGGGAGPLRNRLYPLLIAKVNEAFPVLYLDSTYSRHLNREGLLIAAMVTERRSRAARKK